MDEQSTNLEESFAVDKVSIRLVKDGPLLSDEPLTSPEKVVEKLAEMMSEFDREVVGVINFKADMTPINIHFASMGAINEAVAHPREIMKAAILSNAANMMLLHNHPSGNLEPSKADTMLTDRINQACEIMGIPLTDHIIVGGDNQHFFSFKQKDVMPMSKLRLKTDYQKLDIGSVAEPSKYYAKKDKLPTQVKEITEKLEQGIKDLFDSETYKNYLKTMSKFHSYSFNNTLLIAMQKPDATKVAGYTSWAKDFNRHVKKGEKGIKIFAPAPYKKKELQDVIDPKTNQPVLDADGKRKQEEVEVKIPAFRVVTVFDASQTEGEDLPTLGVNELSGSVEEYQDFMKAMESIAPVPIVYESIESGAKGYFSPAEQKIAIQKDMSELQTVKTAIHELAHSLLHDKDNVRMEGIEDTKKNRETKEVEAESVAYTVCQHFGIDTSEYSFGYLAGWSSGKELPELKESMETIRKTASMVITELSDFMQELQREKEQLLDNQYMMTDIKESSSAELLAIKINDFAKDFDPYGYADDVEDPESQIDMLITDIKNGEISYLVDYLAPIIKDEDGIMDERIAAQNLLKELKDEVPGIVVEEYLFKEINSNQEQENSMINKGAVVKEEQVYSSSSDIIESYRAKTMEVFHELDGENAESIEKMIKAKAQDMMNTMGIDAKVVDAVLIGSRSRGIEESDSDVELVIDIVGDVPAEEIKGLLDGENIKVAGQTVLMEPIVNDKPVPLAQYLQMEEQNISHEQNMQVDVTMKQAQQEESDRQEKTERQSGTYGNFKMVKHEKDNRYLLIADIKSPSGDITKNKPIAEFPNKKAIDKFCEKNGISPENITHNLKHKIEHKQQMTVEKNSNEQEKKTSKNRGGSIDDD